MTANPFTRPYIVSTKGAKQLEALKSPSPRKVHLKKVSVTTINDLAKKYSVK